MEKKFYQCKTCGNVVLSAVDSGVVPFCCGHKMVELVANTTDAAFEKHVPSVTQADECTIRVEVGSIIHPMTPEHHICFIFLETTNGGQMKWLEKDETPSAKFCCRKDEFVAAYAYCNLHGLWKSTDAPTCQVGQPDKQDKKCCGKLGKTVATLTVLIGTMLSVLGCNAQHNEINNTPIQDLSLPNYLGIWYEIARYDHRFERHMTNTSAHYSLNKKGTVNVVNSGWKGDEYKISKGWAKQPDGIKNPGLLRVSFFRPFYSDYRVLMIGDKYDYALVGSKGKDYLWMLSRTPILHNDKVQAMLREAERRGYDTSLLLWVDQSRNDMMQ